jgi:hypothetical protein
MYNLYNFLLPFLGNFIILFIFRNVESAAIIYRYLRKIHIFANLIIIRYTKEAL